MTSKFIKNKQQLFFVLISFVAIGLLFVAFAPVKKLYCSTMSCTLSPEEIGEIIKVQSKKNITTNSGVPSGARIISVKIEKTDVDSFTGAIKMDMYGLISDYPIKGVVESGDVEYTFDLLKFMDQINKMK